MIKTQPLLRALSCALLITTASFAQASDGALQQAINADMRTAEEKARDISRKPLETLSFFEVKPDSRVLEMVPGGGWYTTILGTYLQEKGQLYLAIGARAERLKLEEKKLSHVKIVGEGFEFQPTEQRGISNLSAGEFGVDNIDVVLTFRNLHNMTPDARKVVNNAVFDVLKPGGIYGVIDHTRRHMQVDSQAVWRRADPVMIIKEMLDAGFEFDAYSDLHSRPKDQLIYDTAHESVKRDSDRFTLKFRKPLN